MCEKRENDMNIKNLNWWKIVKIILLWVIPWICVNLFLGYIDAKVLVPLNISKISAYGLIWIACIVMGIKESDLRIAFLPIIAPVALLKFQLETTRDIVLEY